MRCSFLILLLSALLSAADLKIDHVSVAGQDLKAMIAKLGDVGISCEYGGPHSNHATQMAMTSFPDGSYIELIAPQAGADAKALAAHVWAKQMENNAGPCAWAVRPADFQGDLTRLREAGVSVAPPEKSGRERPDGKRLEWETAQIGDYPRGTFFPFVIQDLTPRRDRAFPNGKPATKDFRGLTRVVIAVRDLPDAVKRFRSAYALSPPIQQVDTDFQASLAIFNGTPVVLAAPLNGQSWLAGRLARIGEGPCAFILSARKAGRYKAASKARWSMADISWFDAATVGWRLGFE